MNEYQNIPSVDTLLQDEKIHELIIEYGRPLIIKAINRALDETREAASAVEKVPDSDKLVIEK